MIVTVHRSSQTNDHHNYYTKNLDTDRQTDRQICGNSHAVLVTLKK